MLTNKHTWLFLLLAFSLPVSASWQMLDAGRFADAAAAWRDQPNLDVAEQIGLARAYRHLGLYKRAAQILEEIEFEAEAADSKALLLNERSKLVLSQSAHGYEEAARLASEALEAARQSGDWQIITEVLNQQANVRLAGLDYAGALLGYQNALQNAPVTGDWQAKIRVNQARAQALLAQQEGRDASAALQAGFAAVQGWQDRYSEVFARLQLAELAQAYPALATATQAQLQQALRLAQTLDNALAQSYAYGYLAQTRYQQQAYAEAIRYNQQALFFAGQQDNVAFLWHRQLGQNYRAQAKLGAALEAYRQAAKLLTPLRYQVGNTGFRTADSFRNRIAPVYFELADVLLRQSETLADKQAEDYQRLLKEARQAVEDFKQAEFQEYFQSRCISNQRDCSRLDDLLAVGTAVLYPVVQADHIDLLLSTHDRIRHYSVAVTTRRLNHAAALFLQPLNIHPDPRGLQRSKDALSAGGFKPQHCSPAMRGAGSAGVPLHPDMLKYAQQLYSWLLAPLAADLAAIDTLVVVPDGILRTIPFAALHDGKQFLIEKLAVAVSPSLCLTQAQASVNRHNLLLGGVSESVQGFAAIPCAKYELDNLRSVASNASQTLLLNEQFTRREFNQIIANREFDVVHLASHGEFNPQPEKSFILTYDDKLTLNDLGNLAQLGELRGHPLNLLTLSACETAKGNDRAALGLAGVTLQSGAVSALASLWKVDDIATPVVVLEFYRQWQAGANKAQALRQAQLKLLTDEQYTAYRHPYYWSAFLLIGSWL